MQEGKGIRKAVTQVIETSFWLALILSRFATAICAQRSYVQRFAVLFRFPDGIFTFRMMNVSIYPPYRWLL